MGDNALIDSNANYELTISQHMGEQDVPTGELEFTNYDVSSADISQAREADQSIAVDPAILKEKVDTVIRSVEESSRKIIQKWSVFLTEGEEFEDLCLQRLDQLISEAQILEEAVLSQKQKLFERAQLLAGILCKYNS